jgi:hypothetical protein
MANQINGARRMVVKSAIKDAVSGRHDDIEPGSSAYHDLMANVEAQVQTVLEDEGVIEY